MDFVRLNADVSISFGNNKSRPWQWMASLNQKGSYHNMSWNVMTYHGKRRDFLPKCHEMSRNIIMCLHSSSNVVSLRVLPSRCHQLSWNVFQFNMLTFDDMSWHACHDVVNLIQRARLLHANLWLFFILALQCKNWRCYCRLTPWSCPICQFLAFARHTVSGYLSFPAL